MKNPFVKIQILIASLLFIISCQKNQDTVYLEKVILNTDDSGCWGLCPIYHLEINENRSVRLYVEKSLYYDSICYKTNFEECVPKPDSSKMGYFKGKVNEDYFRLIKNFIEKNRFDTIQNRPNMTNCNDGLYNKFIFYFSPNNRKEVFYNCFGNPQLDSLSDILYQLIDENELERTNDSFFIENSKL